MTAQPSNSRLTRLAPLLVLGLTVLALFLRLWHLDSAPPGWRDDELINSLVISQKVLDGDLVVYYPDASGHEALYHAMNAVMLGLFGPGVAGIRWLSVILGALTIPLTYLVGRRLFNIPVGLAAAAILTFSFWSLMYSRTGIRHISLPFFALLTFYFFLQGFEMGESGRTSRTSFVLAGLFMGLGFYTYFASRGVPLILLAFCIYLLLFARHKLRRHWRGLLLMTAVASLLAVPLLVTLSGQPESEARVAELAAPLLEARTGNFDLLGEHIRITLSMFHADGDDEWLYNIPHRPLFGSVGALFFWGGALMAMWLALKPLGAWLGRFFSRRAPPDRKIETASLSAAFLLLWWLAGIAPAFISVPPASLGHTILAQPAVYILAALPVWWVGRQSWRWKRPSPTQAAAIMGLLLIISVAWRDLPAYFRDWPQRGMVRFLYRADIAAAAAYLNANPELNDFGITGLLAGPWDKLALETDLAAGRAAVPRWYNPERALLLRPNVSFSGSPDVDSPYANSFERLPDVDGIGAYRLNRVTAVLAQHAPICFENGLCSVLSTYDPESGVVELGWEVGEPLQLPVMPLISNPPPPGVYSGPRLYVFAQLQDTNGNFLAGDDGLWVDPATLQPGDLFIQRHFLPAPPDSGEVTAVFGLYDPMTGARILTQEGQDQIRLE